MTVIQSDKPLWAMDKKHHVTGIHTIIIVLYLTLSLTQTVPSYSIDNSVYTHLHHHSISTVDSEKDISVTFDCKLEFERHIAEKINKANATFAMIRRSYKYLSKDVFLSLYKALVRSNLEYANLVWAPYKKKYIEALESVQKRATKTVPALKHMTYEERLRVLNLPTLVYRRIRGDMIETFKITSGVYDKDVVPSLCYRNNSNLRGHSKTLGKKRSNIKLRSENFTQRIVTVWNSLPEYVVSAPSTNAFKNRLDKHWSKQEMKFNYQTPLLIASHYHKVTKEELEIEDL